MNPAFRIWAWAIGLSAIVSLVLSFAAAIMLIVLLLVAIGSLASLLCFYLLFELLHLLKLTKPLFWINAIVGIPAIVALNAWCFLAVCAGNTESVWSLFCDFLPATLIPVTGALIGTGLSHKQINTFCTHEQEAYYPDSCV